MTKRLSNRREFRQVLDHGHSCVDRLLVVYAHPAGGRAGKMGIIVSRKIGGAVERNRVRRRVLEAFRQGIGSPKIYKDVVIIPRHRIKSAKFSEICASLAMLLAKCGAIDPEENSYNGV
ncbi:MAG TPA: ribonuclease P protein component [Firmicutes bacterium]|nr:ribonuclease P protein component [Bacillota bacterium]